MTRARREEGRAIDNRVLRDEPKSTSTTAHNHNHRHGHNYDCNHNRRHDETINHDHNERTTPTRPEIPTAQRGLQPGPRRLRQLLLRRLRRVDYNDTTTTTSTKFNYNDDTTTDYANNDRASPPPDAAAISARKEQQEMPRPGQRPKRLHLVPSPPIMSIVACSRPKTPILLSRLPLVIASCDDSGGVHTVVTTLLSFAFRSSRSSREGGV